MLEDFKGLGGTVSKIFVGFIDSCSDSVIAGSQFGSVNDNLAVFYIIFHTIDCDIDNSGIGCNRNIKC